MKRILVLIVLLVAFCCVVSASSLGELVPELDSRHLETLLAGDYVKLASYDEDFLSMIPQGSLAYDYAVKTGEEMKKGFSTAISLLVPYPEWWKDLSEEERLLKLFNITVQTTTIKGSTYNLGKKPVVIFEDSSLLGSPNRKDRIPNPHFDELPEVFECYSLQKDATYGNTVYFSSYRMEGDELFVSLYNYEPFRMLGISVVGAGHMTMCIDAKPVDEGLYLSVIATMKNKDPQLRILGITIDIEESIFQRVYTLKDWFLSQLYN